MSIAPTDRLVRAGIWLYDGTVPCRVEIWQRSSRPGTGDEEDEGVWREDQPGEWFEVVYHVPGNDSSAGGGFYDSLESALDEVSDKTQESVKWDNR